MAKTMCTWTTVLANSKVDFLDFYLVGSTTVQASRQREGWPDGRAATTSLIAMMIRVMRILIRWMITMMAVVMLIYIYVCRSVMYLLIFVGRLEGFPFKLSAAGVKRGVRSEGVKIVLYRRPPQAQPAKADLGLVMIMIMMIYMMMIMMIYL